jgi:hypothetical protein
VANFEGDGHFEVRMNEWPQATFTVHWVTATTDKKVPVTFTPKRLRQLTEALNEHAEQVNGQQRD